MKRARKPKPAILAELTLAASGAAPIRGRLRPMQQIQLRESELGRRYTELGSFSKSADLQSLFTASSDDAAMLSMWHRLSALACQPMRETGLAMLKQSAESKRGEWARSPSGRMSRKSGTATANPATLATPTMKSADPKLSVFEFLGLKFARPLKRGRRESATVLMNVGAPKLKAFSLRAAVAWLRAHKPGA